MSRSDSLELLLVVAGLAVLAVPVLLTVLLVKVNRLDKEVESLKSVSKAAPAPAGSSPTPLPPPLPAALPSPALGSAPAPAAPSPFAARLRDIGLLPPEGVSGESALGAWWAARVGGLVGVAAVVFLGIWLNLKSELPAWLRLAEVVLIGAAVLVGGLNLARNRPDLGRVITAVGAAILQFAAWASQGLDRMRVVDSPELGVFVQLLTAAAIAALALAKSDRLLGQLATGFSAAVLLLSVKSGSHASAVTGFAVVCVAILGAVLVARGGWTSAGIIGLVGSQLALFRGGIDLSGVVIGASGSFVVCWTVERFVRPRGLFRSEGERLAFSLGSFLLPSLVLLAHGAGDSRTIIAFACAAVAGLLALVEARAASAASSTFLAFALGLAAAGGAWSVEDRLDWLVWLLAGGLALLAHRRTGAIFLRVAVEVFVMFAALKFDQTSILQGSKMHFHVAALLFSLLLAARDRPGETRWPFSVAGGISMSLVLLACQHRLPDSLSVLPWLIALGVSMFLPSVALRFAAAPSFLWSLGVLSFWGELAQGSSHREPALWSGTLFGLSLQALLVAVLRARHAVLRHALAFSSGYLAFLLAHHVVFDSSALWNWRLALPWSCAGIVLAAASLLLRRQVSRNPEAGQVGGELSMLSWGAVVGVLVQAFALIGSSGHSVGPSRPLVLPACFLIVGLGAHLQVLATCTRGSGAWGVMQRSFLPAVWLLSAFGLLRGLPGAAGSLGWAVAAMVTFLVGHFTAARSLRMVGLVGLALVTLRIVTHDVTDLIGRIVACAALAVAFFAVAWIYGRFAGKEER
ncbi:MAG: hypothetical protein ACO3ND_04020 [Opitutales bacterium]